MPGTDELLQKVKILLSRLGIGYTSLTSTTIWSDEVNRYLDGVSIGFSFPGIYYSDEFSSNDRDVILYTVLPAITKKYKINFSSADVVFDDNAESILDKYLEMDDASFNVLLKSNS